MNPIKIVKSLDSFFYRIINTNIFKHPGTMRNYNAYARQP